jgi:hypothetical protein
MGLITMILEPRFPYSKNLCIPCFHRTPDLGWILIINRHFSSIRIKELGHGESNAPCV